MALVRTRSTILDDLGVNEDRSTRLRRLMLRERPVVSRRVSMKRYSLPMTLERRAPGRLKNFFSPGAAVDSRMKDYALRELGRGRKRRPRRTKRRHKKRKTKKSRRKHRKRTYKKH